MSKKLLTIFGATGNQGGSVIATVLNSQSLSSKYALRAITRDTTKPNAQALASKGVELAQADLNDPASIAAAIKGSHGVFAVTNYWETTSKEVEFNQGKNIVDASKSEGVKHLVWSGLPNTTKMTNGELDKIEHFDSKAEVTAYAEKTRGDSLIVSTFMPGFFMSNLLGMVKKQEDGQIGLSQPWDAKQTWLPLLDIRGDTGKYVMGLYELGSAANGAEVQGVSEWVHPGQVTDTIAQLSGQDVKFLESPLTVEDTRSMERIPAELSQNMLLIRLYSYFGKGTEQKQDQFNKYVAEGTKLTGWNEWAKQQKWSF